MRWRHGNYSKSPTARLVLGGTSLPVEQLLAAKALGAIGPGASSAAAALQSLATSENEEVQNAAKEALAEIVKHGG